MGFFCSLNFLGRKSGCCWRAICHYQSDELSGCGLVVRTIGNGCGNSFGQGLEELEGMRNICKL